MERRGNVNLVEGMLGTRFKVEGQSLVLVVQDAFYVGETRLYY